MQSLLIVVLFVERGFTNYVHSIIQYGLVINAMLDLDSFTVKCQVLSLM